MNLFQLFDEPITLHSGEKSRFKVDCDALTTADWEALAYMGMEAMGWPDFYGVIAVPTGGLPLALALQKYEKEHGVPLLVDDVLTTGASMEAYKEKYPYALGLVAFARGMCPEWVTPIFRLEDLF